MNVTLNIENKILDIIASLSGKHHSNEIFFDWVESFAIAINNCNCECEDDIYRARENRYLDITKKYNDSQLKKFVKLSTLLIDALNYECKDILGEIYMKQNYSSKLAGQYFTPNEVAKICSLISVAKGTRTIYEPTCGSGGLIIETINRIKERNVNWQSEIEIIASDMDIHSVHMCYVQLSLLGTSAIVFQSNALEFENIKSIQQERIFCTPRKRGLLI